MTAENWIFCFTVRPNRRSSAQWTCTMF